MNICLGFKSPTVPGMRQNWDDVIYIYKKLNWGVGETDIYVNCLDITEHQ